MSPTVLVQFRIWQSLVIAIQINIILEFCQSVVIVVQNKVVWESDKV